MASDTVTRGQASRDSSPEGNSCDEGEEIRTEKQWNTELLRLARKHSSKSRVARRKLGK